MMTSGTSAVLQARIIWQGRLGFRPSLLGAPLTFHLFRDILRVGLIASAGAVINNVTAISITGLVGRFGNAALAGYGIALRLEYTLIPLLFGLGAALTTLVGVATGARSNLRAIRIAWIGATAGGFVLGSLGLAAVVLANVWMDKFTSDPRVVEAGVNYLQRVGCAYWALGFATCLNLASQGAGRMRWPFTAAVGRLTTAAIGGWCLVIFFDAGISSIFVAVAAGILVYASAMAVPLIWGSWTKTDQ
jgi:Na+-driven multidrug efflux pump